MFNCKACNKTQPPRTKQEKVTLESRPVTYTREIRNVMTGTVDLEVIATGQEIVKEIAVCESCKNKIEQASIGLAA